jgi:hypothetical protein
VESIFQDDLGIAVPLKVAVSCEFEQRGEVKPALPYQRCYRLGETAVTASIVGSKIAM